MLVMIKLTEKHNLLYSLMRNKTVTKITMLLIKEEKALNAMTNGANGSIHVVAMILVPSFVHICCSMNRWACLHHWIDGLTESLWSLHVQTRSCVLMA